MYADFRCLGLRGAGRSGLITLIMPLRLLLGNKSWSGIIAKIMTNKYQSSTSLTQYCILIYFEA